MFQRIDDIQQLKERELDDPAPLPLRARSTVFELEAPPWQLQPGTYRLVLYVEHELLTGAQGRRELRRGVAAQSAAKGEGHDGFEFTYVKVRAEIGRGVVSHLITYGCNMPPHTCWGGGSA